MSHIFLSYSRKDIEMMRRIRDTLTYEDLKVWTDEKLIPGTPSWQEAIEKAIEESACILVLLSPDSKNSEWVRNELSYATTHKKPIYPVLVRGEESDAVPIRLINAQRTDLRTRFLEHMQKLVDTLNEFYRSISDEAEAEIEAAVLGERELLPREQERIEFWTQLLERSKPKTKLFSNVKPKRRYWLSTSAGRSGLTFNYIVAEDYTSVELYIDIGNGEKNKAIFDRLFSEKDQIEAEFGDVLNWRRLEDKRASRIVKYYYNGGRNAPELWPTLQDQMIDGMISLDKTFRKRLLGLQV